MNDKQIMTQEIYFSVYETLRSKNIEDIVLVLLTLDGFDATREFKVYAICLWRLLLCRALYERESYVSRVKFLPTELFEENCPNSWRSLTATERGEYYPPVDGLAEISSVLVGESGTVKIDPIDEYNRIKDLYPS
jgi:hypothetical protein